MPFFGFFKSPPVIQDAFFGSLRFIADRDPAKSCFEGEGVFAPLGIEIGYVIEGRMPGPTPAQRVFYQPLQDTYSSYITRIQPLIVTRFREREPNFVIRDFSKEFTLVAVTSPQLETTPIEWDLSFTTVHDTEFFITVTFRNEHPTGIVIDT